jgi:hypothetical protein
MEISNHIALKCKWEWYGFKKASPVETGPGYVQYVDAHEEMQY